MGKRLRESHTNLDESDVPYQVPLACPDSPSSSDSEVDWISSGTMSALRVLFDRGHVQTTYAGQLAVNECIGAFIANVTPGHESCDHEPNKCTFENTFENTFQNTQPCCDQQTTTDDADQGIRDLFRSGCAQDCLFVDLAFLHNRIAMIDDERARPHRAPTAY